MSMAPDADARRIRQRQVLLFSCIAAVLLVVFAVWMGLSGGGNPPAVTGIEAELAGPGTAEDSWTRRSEARLGNIEGRLRDMGTEAQRLGTENARLREELAAQAAKAQGVIDRQAAMIDAFERRMGGAPGPEGLAGDGPFLPVRCDTPPRRARLPAPLRRPRPRP